MVVVSGVECVLDGGKSVSRSDYAGIKSSGEVYTGPHRNTCRNNSPLQRNSAQRRNTKECKGPSDNNNNRPNNSPCWGVYFYSYAIR